MRCSTDEILRARETLARLDDAERLVAHGRQGQRTDFVDNKDEIINEVWDPTNPRKLTVGTMSTREYASWCDAGRPSLEQPKPVTRQHGARPDKPRRPPAP